MNSGLLVSLLNQMELLKGKGWTTSQSLADVFKNVDPYRLENVTYITDVQTPTRHLVYKDLWITNAGYLNAETCDVTVLGNLNIISGRLSCKNLFVQGDITCEPNILGGYTNLFGVSGATYCLGNAFFKTTTNSCKNFFVHGNMTSNYGLIIDTGSPLLVTNLGSFNVYCNGDFTDTASQCGPKDWNDVGGIVYGTNAVAGASICICARNISFPNLTHMFVTGQQNGCISTSDSGPTSAGKGGNIGLFAEQSINIKSQCRIDASGGYRSYLSNGVYRGQYGSITFNYGNSMGGTIYTSLYCGGGGDGTATKTNTISTKHPPIPPALSTGNLAVTGSLQFNIPADINNSALHINIEIDECLNEVIFVPRIRQTSSSYPDQFSGTKPYPSGTGSATYTIPSDKLISGKKYRWRAIASKNSGSTLSVPSEWRYFIYA